MLLEKQINKISLDHAGTIQTYSLVVNSVHLLIGLELENLYYLIRMSLMMISIFFPQDKKVKNVVPLCR